VHKGFAVAFFPPWFTEVRRKLKIKSMCVMDCKQFL